MRTHPFLEFEDEIHEFDYEIKSALEKIINSSLNDEKWSIASLPFKCGDMFVKFPILLYRLFRVVHSVSDLVKMMLTNYTDESFISCYNDSLSSWSTMNDNEIPPVKEYQRIWI